MARFGERITARMGVACLTAMRRIAEGTEPGVIEGGLVGEALHHIGWMWRDPEDYFLYTDGCGRCGTSYRPDQVLMALALCATLAEQSTSERNG